jgi:hypothetical protein
MDRIRKREREQGQKGKGRKDRHEDKHAFSFGTLVL